ncbi:hypothetical protein [Paenibacillus glucanolyticus]|nr:hypothetical protein [Paenibacillus glucanolyticus]
MDVTGLLNLEIASADAQQLSVPACGALLRLNQVTWNLSVTP